jgi:hypothetical protein
VLVTHANELSYPKFVCFVSNGGNSLEVFVADELSTSVGNNCGFCLNCGKSELVSGTSKVRLDCNDSRELVGGEDGGFDGELEHGVPFLLAFLADVSSIYEREAEMQAETEKTLKNSFIALTDFLASLVFHEKNVGTHE